jgi:hypothetical protein
MANEASSLKKAAVLTGLTMVMGGAEVSTVDAATITFTPTSLNNTFSITAGTFSVATASPSPSFQQFDPSLGTLTSVDFSLDSNISASSSSFSFNATITVDNGVQLSSQSNTLGNYDVPTFTGLVGAAAANNAAFYKGTGFFPVVLTLNNMFNENSTITWDGKGSGTSLETGLTLTYDYTPAAVPLPATLPLFATGLAGLGFTTWLGRRKQKPKAES